MPKIQDTEKKKGCIYLRGRIWWIKYYQRGKAIFESTKSSDRHVASKLLLQREIEAEHERLPNFKAERIKWDELAEDFLRDFRINGQKSIESALNSVNMLKPHFSGRKAICISTDLINKYVDKRRNKGMKNATINRELSALKRMFNLGAQQDPPKVLRVPYISKLKEDNVREGFFSTDEFLALRAALPEHLRPVVTLGFYTGMRKAEILGLRWGQMDFSEGVIRLSQKDTKTRKARIIPMNDEVFGMLIAQKRNRDLKFPDMLFVFYTPKGQPIESFQKAWATACSKVGLSGRLFHDFRRTGVRNMIRAGVPEAVAMAISGHRTRSVFDRYNIIDEADLKLAARRIEAYTKAKIEAESPFKELDELEEKAVMGRERQ